jgi:hypothetical protein
MNAQLNEVTSNLISLIYFYRRISNNNEKIKYVAECSKLLELMDSGESSTKEKLEFCLDAVEAITSEVMKKKAKVFELDYVVKTLDKEEIDFIQYTMFNDSESRI